jgi:alanine racemase
VNLQYSIKEIYTILNVTPPEGVNLNHEISVVNVDSRSPRLGKRSLFFALDGNRTSGHQYLIEVQKKGGQFAVVSKIQEALSIHQIEVESVLDALQLLAKNHRDRFTYPVIGITGSNGKTITKEWLYYCLKDDFKIVRSPKSYNSQLGVALSVLEMTAEHNLAIFEAGISQKGEMEQLQKMIQPTIGVFTGIGDAHNSGFDNQDEKIEEKYKLFPKVSELIENKGISYSGRLPFTDYASLINAQLVLETSRVLGLEEAQLENSISNLPAISMRLEQLEGINNCVLLNDAYTVDFAALEIALQHLNQIASNKKKVLILSLSDDQLALTESDAFADLIYAASLNNIIFIGSKNILATARIAGGYFPTVEAYLKQVMPFEESVILFKGSRVKSLEKIVQHYTLKKHITQLEVSLEAMRNNLNVFRSAVDSNVKLLAMVKAQSYGTGLLDSAKLLAQEGVHYLGVAYADEGVALRKSGIQLPVLVLNPEVNAFDEIIENDLEPSIFSIEVLQEFLHRLILHQKKHFPIHLKLDTGMNRLGFSSADIQELLSILKTQPEVHVKSVFSHLAVADDLNENQFTFDQIRKFERMTEKIEDSLGYSFDRHLANSSAVLNYPQAQFDMVRVGIGLYGLVKESADKLENVLSLHSRISQIKTIQEGESVGYGRSYMATKQTRIGIVPVGYADGLSRSLSQGNWNFLLNGQAVPIIGNICMDMCMIDISGLEASVGDQLQIFGVGNSIFEMAEILDTIPYEIISGISTRVHRVYLG